jgi:hypothetical protein
MKTGRNSFDHPHLSDSQGVARELAKGGRPSLQHHWVSAGESEEIDAAFSRLKRPKVGQLFLCLRCHQLFP